MRISSTFFALILGTIVWGQTQTSIPHRAVWGHDVEGGYVELPALDMERVVLEDQRAMETGAPYRTGVLTPVSLDLDNSGYWTTVPGGSVWTLRVKATGAIAVSPYFDEFHLPEGATLHVYDPQEREVLGAYTSYNNPKSGMYATSFVHGDEMILEYFEPEEHYGKGRLKIGDVSFFYRGIEPLEQPGSTERADPCEVDVACSESTGWEEQVDAVVRILVRIAGGNYWCSGSVMNNTDQDCTPYVLSAHHCQSDGINSSSASDYAQYVVYFNYQRSLCGAGAAPTNQNMTGVTMRANSNDNGGANGSDFLLLEINNSIPAAFDAYYAGWDATGTGSNSGVSIHHPAGDEKKISTYGNTALVSATWGGTFGTHWQVRWDATTNWNGVTEGGSSGSPIFNSTGRVLGQLTGGLSACVNGGAGAGTGPNQPDYYGKMSYNWSNNPNSAAMKLKEWLDPANGGSSTTFSGNYSPCTIGIEENEVVQATWSVYPNPAAGNVNITFDTWTKGKVELVDASGRVVRHYQLDGVNSNLSVDGLGAGFYQVVVLTGGQRSVKPLVLK